MAQPSEVEATVVGRNIKLKACWIRVPVGKHGFKILTLSDDVLPHGMKTATTVRVRMKSDITITDSGYTADIEVLEDLSDASRETDD